MKVYLNSVESPTPSQAISKVLSGESPTCIVEAIRQGSNAGIQSLYDLVKKNATPYLRWRLGLDGTPEIEDRLHNAFLATLEAIRSGSLREPDRLSSFIFTVVRRQAAMAIRHTARRRQQCEATDGIRDQRPGQERQCMTAQNQELVASGLRDLKARDREILVRFYLEGHGRERICKEMRLTDTQFRLYKWRAKARLTDLVMGRMETAPRRPVQLSSHHSRSVMGVRTAEAC